MNNYISKYVTLCITLLTTLLTLLFTLYNNFSTVNALDSHRALDTPHLQRF